MDTQFKMYFSIINCSSGQVIKLGSIEETVWSLVPSLDTSGKVHVDIIRSRGNGNVKLDVRILDVKCIDMFKEEVNLLSINDFLLLDGMKSTRFLLRTDFFFVTSKFKGYVTIHYNLKTTLKSKKEAVTQTEHSIVSIVEKITPSLQLMTDLLHLLDNRHSFSDATLICNTTKFPVHRNILSARSPVFATMFKTQMQEGRDGIVNIVDMEPDVLQAMLKYVYSGKTDHFTCYLAEDLLFAADKYQLGELKMICVKELKSSMTASNVFRSLVLGELHDKSLKAFAVKFICKCTNFSDLEKSQEWQSLLKERSSLAVEVLTTFVKCLQKK